MAELKKRALALLSVKSIVTIMLASVVCYMAMSGSLTSETMAGFFGTVLTFYFVKEKSEKKEE